MNHTFKSKHFDLAVDTITPADIEELIEWLRAYPRLTMAHVTREFEEAWSKWLGVKYSVFCNSGSSADLLMYAALDSTGRSKNRTVVVPAVGWSTTIAPAIQLGWQPVMCEAEPKRYGLDPVALEKMLEREHPDNVILVHVLGTPADMEALQTLQKKYGFNLMEDCCAAHGARYRGRKVGTFGDMSSFSFFYGHHMSTIEGGMICTNDEELYHHLLMLRSHGWCRDLPAEKQAELMEQYGVDPFHSPFMFLLAGYNLRPLDLTAQVGLVQLPRLGDTVRRRVENHRQYQNRLEGVVDFARADETDTISSISFGGVAASSAQRKQIVSELIAHEIDTRIFSAGNLGRHPFWTERYGSFSAPVADRIYDCGFFLPNNQVLDSRDVDFVSDVVIRAVRG